MLIAIDHGNYAIKTPRFSFVAGLSEHATKPPLADEVIEYGGSVTIRSTVRPCFFIFSKP